MATSQKTKPEPRDKWLHVKVSVSEREHLKMLAHSQNITVADLVRQALDHRLAGVAPKRQRLTRAADPVLLAALGRIGNNLNQVGRWVNRHKSAADAVEVLAALVAINRELKALVPGKGGDDVAPDI
ncbi:MAG: MobC family plasmid mobilization relaxosome protein [Porticoccaceae bacterium]